MLYYVDCVGVTVFLKTDLLLLFLLKISYFLKYIYVFSEHNFAVHITLFIISE